MRSICCGFLCLFLLAGCGTTSRRDAPVQVLPPASAPVPAAPAPSKGGYYKDDGPGANPPPNLAAIPDAVPKAEPLHRFANRPYQVFGKDYVPVSSLAPFRQTGIGSWYGRRFHGASTSSGETYDMYAMTAAHPTLPIPSYARVTNLANGRSVVVRVNDRGPFHSDRVIDLSYVAAWKLGYAEAGSTRVEVEAIVPGIPSTGTVIARTEPRQEPEQPQPQPEAKGVYLQLGAFSAREAAENFRVRVYRELAWLSEAIQIVAGGPVFRLHLGPYRSQEEARSIADRIQTEFKLRPVLVVR
jgi:rare lipoprotein A